MEVYKQEKEGLNQFLQVLRQDYEVIAPVKKDLVRFEKIENLSQVYLKEMSYFPAKNYFLKQEQKMFTFNGNDIQEVEEKFEPRVFFGLRKCDLNAIKHQDMVFTQNTKDPYYIRARENSVLIGYHCETAPSEFCFCESLNLVDYFDLMFYEKQDYFLVEVGSEKGKAMVEKYPKLFATYHRAMTQQEKKIKNADRLENKDLSKLYDNPDWKKGSEVCLSCGACTTLCPTCYCFEIKDTVKTSNLKEGERTRSLSSCQLPEFSKVAGDHVFRQERDQRFKHRIYHQLEYFKEKHGVDLCVGCGRCISGCPTRIDFVKIINEMQDGKKTN